MTTAMERHIQQTNERLLCIKEALGTPGSGFQSAARELLEWCGDSRAFQKVFETNLVGCLTVVSQVAAQQGFDLDLGYRLLAVCAAQRDKFSSKSAALLSLWCEDLGRLLLLRHQNTREEGGMHPAPPPHNKNNPSQHQPTDMATLGWQQPPSAPSAAQQQLSVVTTVWGVTSTTQPLAPYASTTTMAPYASSPPQQPYPPPPAAAKPFPGGQPRQPPAGYNGYGGGPGAGGGDFQASPSQVNLSAAALVAAAATATATATASVVALQERPPQGPYQPANTYGRPPAAANNTSLNHSMCNPAMNKTVPSGGMYAGQGRARAAPYPPSPHLAAAQKRPPPPPPNPAAAQYMGQQYGPPYGGTYGGQYGGSQFPAKQQQYPPQYPPQQPMRASMRPQYQQPPGGPQYYQQMNGGTPQPYETPHYVSQYGVQPHYKEMVPVQQRAGGGTMPPTYQQQIPTPPLTPAGTSYLSSPTPDLKPTFPDLNKPKDDELRLTFPVRDGIILAPFRLEHNLAVSNHVFHLKPSVHQTLMWRSDLELQLKCFHHEDRQMNTNWPASVQVSVNATPLSIDRGDNKASHRPLYLKEVCQAGRNTIQITVTACCCSHLFLLQLVHRPTVRSVLQGLLRKRLLPAEHCVSKIKRNFSSTGAPSTPPNAAAAAPTPTEDGVEQTAIKVSLKCPITFKRITLPARGQECKHIQCFDLESYLQLNCERGAWRCPVCNKPALLEGLEVDQYVWGILTTLAQAEVEEVTIDGTASWKPVPIKPIKEEIDGGDSCSGAKRFKAMSPSSMTLPTSSSWEMTQGLSSPYPADNGSYSSGGTTAPGGSYQGDFQQTTADFGSPLSHLNDSVSSLDPLAAMEKSLNHHEQQMGPPSNANERPATAPHTPGSVPPEPTTNSQEDLGELNFDPAAVIEGEGQGQEALNLLPESVVDPMELLSYLDPPDPATTAVASSTTTTTTSDDLLALFDS